MQLQYILVQAEERGEALAHYTKNKPNALVPVDNCPILFHLFQRFPKAHYIVVGDYQFDVLKRYVSSFFKGDVTIIKREQLTDTIKKKWQPDRQALLLKGNVILAKNCEFPEGNDTFLGQIDGKHAALLCQMGEAKDTETLVEQFFADAVNPAQTTEWDLKDSICYDSIEKVTQVVDRHCRPFNQMEWSEEFILKEGRDAQGLKLAAREISWYQSVQQMGFEQLPRIYSYEPFIMERITGKNMYAYEHLTYEEKAAMLTDTVDMLKKLHALGKIPAEKASLKDAYAEKTFDRLNKVRDLIPFADREEIVVNKRRCRNVLFHKKAFEQLTDKLATEEFTVIHGDCTFSNIMFRETDEGREPILIDPRGYFGFTELYGDAKYDWAKLYYSVVGNFDQFNNKNFSLTIHEKEVEVQTGSNHWEDMEEFYLELLGDEADRMTLRFIHTIFWLSLTSYAWEDYDSICGAFYNGIYHLEPLWDIL